MIIKKTITNGSQQIFLCWNFFDKKDSIINKNTKRAEGRGANAVAWVLTHLLCFLAT